jgi:hypothetical protein
MARVLGELRDRIAVDNPALGDAQLLRLREQLPHVPSGSPKRARQLGLIGVQELKLGNNAEAVTTLQQAYRLALDVGEALPPAVLESTLFQLSLAHLRLGETQNCVLSHTSESCLFPIEGEGVHRLPMGSTQAVKHLLLLLDRDPGNLPARWILNIAYMTLGTYPDEVPAAYLIPPSAFESEEEFPRFAEIAPNLSLDVMSLAGGMITDDFDGDRLLDVVVSEWNPGGQLRYFRNRGDGRFDDVAVQLGVDDRSYTKAVVWGDYDGDGLSDLYVSNFGSPNRLFHNRGGDGFVDVAPDLGVHLPLSSFPAWFWDFNNDGALDLYVSSFVKEVGDIAADYLGLPVSAERDRLYQGDGKGGFREVSVEQNLHRITQPIGSNFGDLDNDGDQDVVHEVGGWHAGDATRQSGPQ